MATKALGWTLSRKGEVLVQPVPAIYTRDCAEQEFAHEAQTLKCLMALNRILNYDGAFEVFSENRPSAHPFIQPVLSGLLHEIEAGRHNILAVSTVDRFSRNSEHIQIVNTVCQMAGCYLLIAKLPQESVISILPLITLRDCFIVEVERDRANQIINLRGGR
jgi:hypothetical protein